MTSDQCEREVQAFESIAASLLKIAQHLEESGPAAVEQLMQPPVMSARLDGEKKHLAK